ncbi:unnamed protein product, partial [Oppiella nova]
MKERKNSHKKYNDFIELLMNAQKDSTNNNTKEDDNDVNEAHHVNEGKEEKEVEKKILSNVDKYITEEEILAQSWVFFVAGYETTATTLTFASYELALNQDSQQRLYEEILTSVDSNGEIDYDLLSKLPYLDAVISETLRLDAPAVVLIRQASEDYKLGNTGITLYKGQQLEMPITAIHHNEEFYENAYQFIPERFLPENRHKIKPYTYLPFGAGPRNCIGMRFGLMEAKLALAQVVRRYRFFQTPNTDVPLQLNISMAIHTPKRVIIGIEKRLYLTRNFNFWSQNGVKGPSPIPMFGNILSYFITPRPHLAMQWQKLYGKIYGIYNGNRPVLIVAEPELIKQICVKDFHIFTDRNTNRRMHPILSRHLVAESGDDWKRIRSIVTPTFSSSKMKKMYPMIRQCLDDFIVELDVYAKDKGDVNVKI